MPNELATPYFPIYAETADRASASVLADGVSAIFGGSQPALRPGADWPRCGVCDEPLIPYVQINVSSPHTPSEFRQAVAVRPGEPGHSVVLEVLVCAADEGAVCFQDCVVSGGAESPAWLVRVVQLERVDAAQGEAARAEMGEDKFFLPLKVISGWAAGRPEMVHEAANYDYDEELYAGHAPKAGLKLLGFPIQGMQV